MTTLDDVTNKPTRRLSSPQSSRQPSSWSRPGPGTGPVAAGPEGLLKQLTKTVLETALNEEMTEHLGYEKHDPPEAEANNVRNGIRSETVLTDTTSAVEVDVPRDPHDPHLTPAAIPSTSHSEHQRSRRRPTPLAQHSDVHGRLSGGNARDALTNATTAPFTTISGSGCAWHDWSSTVYASAYGRLPRPRQGRRATPPSARCRNGFRDHSPGNGRFWSRARLRSA